MKSDISNIHKGHRQRLRKRFAENGLNGFQTHEIVELMLFYSIPRANTNEVAHDLINRFGSVYGILKANEDELDKVYGISHKSVRFIKTFNDVCHYYLSHESLNQKPADIMDYVRNYFSEVNRKIYLVIGMGNDMTIKSTYTFMPDVVGSSRLIQELAVMTFKNNIHDIVIAHNCGRKNIPVPNRDDYFVVKHIAEGLKPLGIDTTDYIISNGTVTFSMYQNGVFGF